MISARTSAVVLFLALAGCDAFGSVDVSATFAAEADGDTVDLRLVNTATVAIELAALPCSARLEVREGGRWEPSPYEPLFACAEVRTVLEPRSATEATYPVAGLPAGTYRFRVSIRAASGGGGRTVVSNEFTR
jgi:hypothetical protein